MTMRNDGPGGIDDLFAMARADRAIPSEALMARVMADALAEQPQPRPAAAAPVAGRAAGRGVWSRLADLFGGIGALAGMGGAAAAGLLIGYVQPEGLLALGDAVLGTPLETVEVIPSVETLFSGE